MHKYRGKRIDGEGWVEGWYVADEEWAKHYIYYPKHTGAYIQLVRVEVDPATVGQATGLKDKKGIEAYNDDGASILITDELMKSSFGNSNLAEFVRDNSITECIVQMKPSKCLSVDYTCYFKKGNDFLTYSDMGVGDGTIFSERAYDVGFLGYFLSNAVIISNTTDNPDLLTTQTTTDGNK